MSQRALRWAPLAGPIFVVLFVIGFVVAGSSPDPSGSQAKITKYLGDSSSYHKNEASYIVLLAAILFLVVFFASLRSRLVAAEGGLGRFGALAFGAGIASTVLLFVAITLFISAPIAAHDAGSNLLDPGIFRFTQDAGYLIWVGSVVVGALSVWATAAVSSQAGLLPRWYVWFSVIAGIISLAALAFFPIFLYLLWIVITGILLALRPAPTAE